MEDLLLPPNICSSLPLCAWASCAGTGSHQVRRPLGYFRSWHSSRAWSLASTARAMASALAGVNMPGCLASRCRRRCSRLPTR